MTKSKLNSIDLVLQESSTIQKSYEKEESYVLPNSFPNDFPLYPGATLVSSWGSESENATGMSVVYETADSVEDVAQFYKQSLEKNSWELLIVSDSNESFTATVKKSVASKEQKKALCEGTEKTCMFSGFIGVTSTDSNKTALSVTIGLQ